MRAGSESNAAAGSASAARVLSPRDANALVDEVLAVLAGLEAVLEQETAHLRVGRLREGLAQEARKAELTSSYLRGLEAVKANAIALARFAPDALERLKGAHRRFAGVIEVNQTVLATARAVSETLVKSLSDELNRAARPQGYAPAGLRATAPLRSEPLVVSKRF